MIPILAQLFPSAWRRLTVLAWLLFPFVAEAHIGSPNVYFEGPAGPYPVRITIQPPQVVPGLAQIHVRVHSGQPDKVTVLPVRWDVGTRGAPAPDVAKLVAGETNLFTSQLWLMNSGSYSVFVDVSGPQGHGTAVVPINSLAMKRLIMPYWMGVLFVILGIFLFVLLISVVGSAAREATLPDNAQANARNRRYAYVAMAIALLIAGGVLVKGKTWWESEDQSFRDNRLYRAQAMVPVMQIDTNGFQQLTLNIASTRHVDSTPYVPDHGHLVHLFLIREPAGDVFAHLHPVRTKKSSKSDEAAFTATLPALPAGDYKLYADITHESGFTQTLTNNLHLSAASTETNHIPVNADADDTLDLSAPGALAPSKLVGDFTLNPAFSAPIRANQETTLRFDLTTATGEPAPLEPYLGMYGHLIIQHADGEVFTHLHPLGSISMASQKLFAEREHAGYLANQPLDLLCAPPSKTLAFPYAFPRPGTYRIWLQTKLQGQVRTSAYSVTVE